jgi:molybdopterin-synthase adenylyltransferase
MSDERYSRQSFLGDNAHDVFDTARIAVIGLGGGGSHVVQQLAHIGFKRIILFDDDVVKDHNLNRLIGARLVDALRQRLKVAVALRMIRGLQPRSKVEAYPSQWQSNSAALRRCNLAISCVDTFAARRDLESFARRYLIPLIDIGIDIHPNSEGAPSMAGQVILSMPDYPCMECLGFLNEQNLAKEAQRYGAVGGRPQVVWPNGIVASTAVGVAVDLLTDWSKSLRGPVYLSYDGNRHLLFENRRLKYAPQRCTHYPLTHVGAPVFKLL